MERTDLACRLTGRLVARAALAALAALVLACDGGSGGGGFADNGGMSGTGISQGAITAFGSIFVNGVEWEVDDASVELDGRPGDPSDLRRGMVVRVNGDFAADGLSGTAVSVIFDDSLEGPIGDDPVVIDAQGLRKQFSVLGVDVIAHATDTVFDDGASFDGLDRDQVVEVSGFADADGVIRATRVELKGSFPDLSEVELRGVVENWFPDMSGGGVFDLGPITVIYTAATDFEDGGAGDLENGVLVEVEGTLRSSDELDADEIEFEEEGLGDEDRDEVEIEGFVRSYVSDASFVVAGVSVNASSARFDPSDLVLADGVQVEVKGPLQGGVLIADEVEAEGDDDPDEDEETVYLEAAVSAVTASPKTLTIVGVSVTVDGETELEDDRDDVPNFRFEDIAPGDWLEIEAVATGAATARALDVERDEPESDVVLQGPVTDIDPLTPALEVLGIPIPIDGGTVWIDADGDTRSEEQFFRNPGDLRLDDVVRVTDEDAADPEELELADTVEIEEDDD